MLGLRVQARPSPTTNSETQPQVNSDETQVVLVPKPVGGSSSALLASFDDAPSTNNIIPKSSAKPSLVRANTVALGDLDPTSPATSDSLFASPNARLVRSMRRCDRKFIPFLTKWSVVDVAMTRYEMVYFAADAVDEESALDAAGKSARQAIMATKGGKGLRLCDVAVGRRVVGHLHFSEIDSVHVERRMPLESNAEADECPDVEVEKNEFWQQISGRSHASVLRRGDEWCGIKQDLLRIHTIHGHTLYLRFYSDLEDARHHAARLESEDEANGFLFKDNSFQWAQTIVRTCGPAKLQQNLPHFADDTSEELRDFLVVNHGTEPPRGHHRGRSVDGVGGGLLGLLKMKAFGERIEI
jgi:hypothetical protein